MIKKIIPVFFFITLFTFCNSQEVKSLSTITDLEELFSSLKGKPVLVNIWATWCKPCVKEFPDLIKLYGNYHEQGLEIVFISVDEKADRDTKLPAFLKKQGVDFVTYFNEFKKPEEIIDYFDKTWGGAIPATYIYNKEGKPVKTLTGSQNYETFENEIKKLL